MPLSFIGLMFRLSWKFGPTCCPPSLLSRMQPRNRPMAMLGGHRSANWWFPTTESDSSPPMRSASLICFNDCTAALHSRAPAWDLQSAGKSSSGTEAPSSQKARWGKAHDSSLSFRWNLAWRAPNMTSGHKPITILVADDDPDDRQMTREAFEECRLAND